MNKLILWRGIVWREFLKVKGMKQEFAGKKMDGIESSEQVRKQF